jgi:hypothetical protein
MKTLATLTAASLLALAGGAAVAQTSPVPDAPAPSAPPATAPATPAPAPAPTETRRPREMSATDLRAIVDARLAGVPTGLKLTAEQQRLWPSVEEALRGIAAERIARIEERRSARSAPQAQPAPERDLAQRLEERSRRASEAAQRLQALSSAMTPFWASLNDDQKRILPVLIRPTPVGQPGWRDGGRGGREGRRAMMDHHREHHGGRDMHDDSSRGGGRN